jgi:hypothetical protein
MRIALLGYGKMGKVIEQIALERGHEISLKIDALISNIEILDFKGMVILETKENTIDISGLTQGIYLAKVFTQNGEYFMRPFVKN